MFTAPPLGRRIQRAVIEAIEDRTLLSFVAHVDFQPSNVRVYPGYVIDSGAAYASRGNGFTYGWNVADNNTRVRNSSLSPDQRYDTFNYMQKSRSYTWQIAVPKGSYQVHIVSGDPTATDSIYKINAEGVLAVSGTPTSANRWVQGTVTVAVSDGRLTISNAPGSSNNKINFIDIVAAPPAAPTAVAATALSSSQVKLTWSANTTNTDGFTIQRSTNGGALATVGTVAGSILTYTDSGRTDGTTYAYRISAYNSTGASAYSAAGTATTPLAVPGNLQAAPNANTSWINLSWAGSTMAEGYAIDRSTDGVSFAPLATVAGASTTRYTDSTAAPGASYTYRVSASSAAAGRSAPSAPVSASASSFAGWRNFVAVTPAEPNPSTYGMGKLWTLGGGFWSAPHVPSESATRATADQAVAGGAQILVVDIEDMPNDVRTAGAAAVANTVSVISPILDWIKSEQPGLKVGLYDLLPLAPPPAGASAADVQAWQNAEAALDPLMQRVDCLVPCLYTMSSTVGTQDAIDWQREALIKIASYQGYGKPIYPYLMPVYIYMSDIASNGGNQPLPESLWRLELETMRRYADGFVNWSGNVLWNATAPWYLSTLQFAAATQTTAIPAPASNLSAIATDGQISLAWSPSPTGPAGVDGYTIERSTDNTNFGAVGNVGPTTTTFIDTQVFGRTYYYRVRAMTWLTDAAPSNTVSVGGLRTATATQLAPSYEASFGSVFTTSGYVGVSGGNWLKYGRVDFSAGLNTFATSISVPGSGIVGQVAGQLDLHLDSPSGPVIGSLGLAATGGWDTFVNQSAGISSTSGIHDLYLSFSGNPHGVASVASFSFSNAVAPAAPAALMATTPGPSQVALAWSDNSAGSAGFKVERSTDGTNFSGIALLAAGTTTYTDANPSGGSTYFYRVRANTATGGDSAASNVVSAAPYRDARAVTQASNFDSSGGTPWNFGSGVAASGGQWIEFNNVNFGSGLSTFTATVATARGDGAGSIEIHVDGLNGPLIGTLMISGTGSWDIYVPQSRAISSVAGVHNLYLVFQGYGAAITSLQFS